MQAMMDSVQAASEWAAQQDTVQWPLTSPEWLVGANAVYVIGVLAGKAVMQSDSVSAFSLKWYRAVYNLSCVLLSLVSLVLISMAAVAELGPKYVCNDSTNMHPRTRFAVYVFYLSKFWEYQDTLIMILRKKFQQVSFLHVYHHASISVVVYLYLKYSGGGDEFLAVALNSLVHVLMYSHYLVATFGLSTPWKSTLTTLQLIQFCLIMTQALSGLAMQCGPPGFINVCQVLYMGTMLALFGNFYVNSYMRPKKKAA